MSNYCCLKLKTSGKSEGIIFLTQSRYARKEKITHNYFEYFQADSLLLPLCAFARDIFCLFCTEVIFQGTINFPPAAVRGQSAFHVRSARLKALKK
jgi:hypothetical protein